MCSSDLKFTDKYGPVAVMRLTGFFIPLIPFVLVFTFFFSNNQPLVIIYLICMELLNGIIWGGFNLATTTFLFNAVSTERMAICTSYYSMINAVVIFIAAAFGGYLSSLPSPFILPAILIVFLISAMARMAVYLSFFRNVNEVGEAQKFDLEKTIKKTIEKKINLLETISLDILNFRFFKHKEAE